MYSRPLFLFLILFLFSTASAQIQTVRMETAVNSSNQSYHRLAFDLSLGSDLRSGLIIRFPEKALAALAGIEADGSAQWLKQAAGASGVAEAWHWQIQDSVLTVWFPFSHSGSERQIRLIIMLSGTTISLNKQQIGWRSFNSEEERLNQSLMDERRFELNFAQPTQN